MSESDSTVEYRDVEGFPGYRVGNDGTVWSCRSPSGKGNKTWPWRLKKPNITTKLGHCRVDFFKGKDERFIKYVHRLVLETFIGPCPDGMEACHNDGNPRNNRLDNLRWDTPSSNMQDKKKHGTNNHGERHGAAKLTDKIVREILLLSKSGISNSEIGEKLGINRAYIGQIVRKERWSHVS